MATRRQFAAALLAEIGAPWKLHTRRALQAWMQAEGGTAKNNPFNTTQRMPRSTTYNWVGVQNYASMREGVEATKITLGYKNLGYGWIRQALKRNYAAWRILRALDHSDWGTSGQLADEVLDDIQKSRTPNTLLQLESRKIAG